MARDRSIGRAVISCDWYSYGSNQADQRPGGWGRITSPCRFMSLFFLLLFELVTSSSSSSLPSSVLNMHRPFYWHEMLFPSNQLKRLCVCVCVCACVCVIYLSCLCFFCVTPVRLSGRTYRANASQIIFLYSCNAIWYFYYTPCIVSFSPLFIYFSCKYIFC